MADKTPVVLGPAVWTTQVFGANHGTGLEEDDYRYSESWYGCGGRR